MTEEQPKSRKWTRRRIILTVSAGLMLTCCALGSLITPDDDTETVAPTTLSQQGRIVEIAIEEDREPEPTDTRQPINTPQPDILATNSVSANPTSTSSPTNVPTPTSTPIPTSTPLLQPLSLSEIDLEKLSSNIIVSGDVIEPREITDNYGMQSDLRNGLLPAAAVIINQGILNPILRGGPESWGQGNVVISLYNSREEAIEAFEIVTQVFKNYGFETFFVPAGEVSYGAYEVGYRISFVRCNAFIFITTGTSLKVNSETGIVEIHPTDPDMLKYFEALDNRIAPIICNQSS